MWRTHPATMVAGTYCVLGLIYITVSDEVVRWFVSDAQLMTEIQTYKGWGWITLTTLLIYSLVRISVRAVQAADRERFASDTRYRTMIETTNEGVVVADAGGICIYVNQTLANIMGMRQEELVGKRCGECVSEPYRALVERPLAAGKASGPSRFDCEFVHRDGTSVWAIVSASPMIDEETGERIGTLFMVTDITARKMAERALERNLETQRSLLNELDHRVRNNLSSLSSLIDLSRSATGDVEEFAAIMGGRVQAMAKAHALSARAGPDGVDLGRIIAEMIPDLARSRVSIDGPNTGVPASQIVSIAMLLHELASRSARSGATSHANGRAVISWIVDLGGGNGGTIVLRWWESPVLASQDAEDIHADALINGLAERDLRGSVSTSRDNDALVINVRFQILNEQAAVA